MEGVQGQTGLPGLPHQENCETPSKEKCRTQGFGRASCEGARDHLDGMVGFPWLAQIPKKDLTKAHKAIKLSQDEKEDPHMD